MCLGNLTKWRELTLPGWMLVRNFTQRGGFFRSKLELLTLPKLKAREHSWKRPDPQPKGWGE